MPLRVSTCIRVSASAHRKFNVWTRLDVKGSLHPDASFVQRLRDVRTIRFRATGCALISTVCSSVLCSLVVVFEVRKKRNLYMVLYTTFLSMDTGKLCGTTSWNKK